MPTGVSLFVLAFNLKSLKKPEYAVRVVDGAVGICGTLHLLGKRSESHPRVILPGERRLRYILLFVISMAKFIENLYDPEFCKGKKNLKIAYGVVGIGLLVLHMGSQLVYLNHIWSWRRYMI